MNNYNTVQSAVQNKNRRSAVFWGPKFVEFWGKYGCKVTLKC